MPNRKVSVALEADLADVDRLVCIRLGLDLESVGSQRQVHRGQIQRNGVPADWPVAAFDPMHAPAVQVPKGQTHLCGLMQFEGKRSLCPAGIGVILTQGHDLRTAHFMITHA